MSDSMTCEDQRCCTGKKSALFGESLNNMEAEISNANHMPDVRHQFLPVVFPMLLISIGYVDPGKWAAVVEVVPDLVYGSRIGVVTGRDLAQICSDEYDKSTCMLLGIQTELSMIALDLTMILGIAHGLHLMFGADLFSCVFLTAIDAVLFPLFATLLENGKVKFLCIWMVGFVLLCYALGVLISLPEIPLSINGMPTKFSGESAFALMSLLGANIMPHNFLSPFFNCKGNSLPPSLCV
ncbi:Ethylene-insensitive protein 2 [Vitis vinifera]|uniref:Ethylene-insensitive protein 2 n=1 Tax=Vitis vinifera TaxID=29760 RepID=A0A438D3X7_VITVI|nr:Ethylene-insensitive protein 2 [Vitis vinifera]